MTRNSNYKIYSTYRNMLLVVFAVLYTKSFSQPGHTAGMTTHPNKIQKSIDQITRSRNLQNTLSLPQYISLLNNEATEGAIFAALAKIEKTRLFIFAPNGEPLYERTVNDFCYDFKILSNGLYSYFEDDLSGFVILDSMMIPVDTIRTIGYKTDYHELRITPDSCYMLFGLAPRSVDMSVIIEGGDPNATVMGMVLQKVDQQKRLLFEWNSFDHLSINDSYAVKNGSYIDYVHFNSLEIDTDSTAILSSRNLSELSKVNLTNGEIIWRLGGKNNQFSFRNFDRMFSGQHSIRKKNDSLFTLYDNGLYFNEKYSRGIEFVIDEDSMIIEKTNEFRKEPDMYSPIMGNLQNLDNGHTLVTWGGNTFSEFDSEGNIVQEGKFINCDIPTYGVNKYIWSNPFFSADHTRLTFLNSEPGQGNARKINIFNHTNEEIIINDFSWNRSAFDIVNTSLTLLPGESTALTITFFSEDKSAILDTLTIRSDSEKHSSAIQLELIANPESLGNEQNPIHKHAFNLYPVPFSETISFRTNTPGALMEITDINGGIVLSKHISAMCGVMDTSGLLPGMYIATFISNTAKHYQKIMKY